MSDRIVGKVARVNSDRELILNRGSRDGVTKGTVFYIKGEPIEVPDPDTKEIIGVISPIKVVVQVYEVGDGFCIARTFRTRRVQVDAGEPAGELFGRVGSPLSRMLQPPKPPKFETKVETLRADPTEGQYIDESDSVVQVGDIAESVLKGEDINPVTTTVFR